MLPELAAQKMGEDFEQPQVAKQAPTGVHKRCHRLMGTSHGRNSVGHQGVRRDGVYFDHQVTRSQTWTARCSQNGARIQVIDGGPQSLRKNQPNQVSVERFLTYASEEAILDIDDKNRSGSPVARKCLDDRGQRIFGMIHRRCEMDQATKLAYRALPGVTRLARRSSRR